MTYIARALFACILLISHSAFAACMVAGCSSQLCVPEGASTCEWQPAFACYKVHGECVEENGNCTWKQTPELARCIANPEAAEYELDLENADRIDADRQARMGNHCARMGTFGQVCVDAQDAEGKTPPDFDSAPNPAWDEKYRCYQQFSTCTPQPDGICGWTPTPALGQCLTTPAAIPEPMPDK